MFKPYGVIPAMVTPIDEDERVNLPVLAELTNYLIDGGVHGLFVLGSQGEFWAFDFEEKREIVRTVVDATAGRLPVYVGTAAVTTREAVRLTVMAEDLGASAVSVLTPFFISPNSDELYEHYVAVAKSTKLPVILYGNPARTNCHIRPELVSRLARVENIVGIKDSSGDLGLTAEYIRVGGDEFSVLAGRDTLILATLLYGGRGSIAATGNVVPGLVASIYDRFVDGDLDGALEAQRQLAPLRHAFGLGTFPVVVKEALNMIGMPVGRCRAPVGEMKSEACRQLRQVLVDLGLIS